MMKMKEDNEKAGLKINIQKRKIMTSSPIISGQIVWETMETVTDFIFLDCKITVDGDCNHEIKRCLPLGRQAMTNLDSILKSRDITLPTKVLLVKVTEKAMATHSSVLAWRILGTEEPGGLLSLGSQRVRHYRSNLAAATAAAKVMVFPVVMNGCEGWTIKKAEC